MNGRNFLIELDGNLAKHGFYQNIFVEAENPNEAEFAAIERIRNNEDLKSIVRNHKDDPPAISLDEIFEIDSITESDKTMEKGCTFYKEKKWWQIWK